MRPLLRTIPVLRQAQTRLSSSSFTQGPSPPKLPADQQAEFERLQRAAAVSSAFQETPASPPSTQTPRHTTAASSSSSPSMSSAQSTSSAVEEEDVRGGLYRGAPPEFRGDKNPKTGEVGGPKNEPLRWGDKSDWSYNGRVTDF